MSSSDLERVLAEQAECRDYLNGDGENKSGAWAGVTDWHMEEALILAEDNSVLSAVRPSLPTLKAPFPWFGGKSRVASLVWERFGDTPNYVEPFAGSLAVLLGRPHEPHTETINDKDYMVANFWRALQCDREAVAEYADWPVNEADQNARHNG